jgi:uncharacterized protein (DUF983 family)
MNVPNLIGWLPIAAVNAVGARESYFQALMNSAGRATCLVILTIGLAAFIGACFVVAKCRPATIASCLVLLPLPLIVSVFGLLGGLVQSLLVLSASPESQPTTAQFATAAAASLSPLFLWFTVTLPSYLVLGIGLVLRTLKAGKTA